MEAIREANAAVDRVAKHVERMEDRFGRRPALAALLVVSRVLLAELPVVERVRVEQLAERIAP